MFYCKVKDRCRTPHAASVFFTLHKIFILSVCDLNAVDHRLFVCFDCSIIIRWVGIFADFINRYPYLLSLYQMLRNRHSRKVLSDWNDKNCELALSGSVDLAMEMIPLT